VLAQQIWLLDASDMQLERGDEQDKPGKRNEIRGHQRDPESKRDHGGVDGIPYPCEQAGVHECGGLLLIHPDPPGITHQLRPDPPGGFSRRGDRGQVNSVGLRELSEPLPKVRVMSQRRFRRTAGGVWSLELHLVWCPKYRRRIKEVMADHVHLLVRVGLADTPAAVVGAFKGRTARVLCQGFPYLCNRAKVWWSRSCSAASVDYVWESAVRRDIEHQWDAVLVS
jgi:putative transposase